MNKFFFAVIAVAGLFALGACELSRDRPPSEAIYGSWFPAGPDYTGPLPGPGYKAVK